MTNEHAPSIHRYLKMAVEKRQGETSRDNEAHPLKNQRWEEGPSGPSEGHQTIDEGGKTCGVLVPTVRYP